MAMAMSGNWSGGGGFNYNGDDEDGDVDSKDVDEEAFGDVVDDEGNAGFLSCAGSIGDRLCENPPCTLRACRNIVSELVLALLLLFSPFWFPSSRLLLLV
ncbi:hypothetical protein SUGI_0523010 [Cryptomeria japonica]|nr:hypothetical protein SUGI_0523010 [Cryptomeria japonica]